VAGSIFVGAEAEAHHAAAVEREEKLERIAEAFSEGARATVGQLLQVERNFAERRVAAGAELAVIDHSAGDDLLEAALAGNGAAKAKAINTAVTKLRAELDTLDQATEAARSKRGRAILSVYRARAAAIRAEAAPLIARAEEEAALTIELLDVIEGQKGVRPTFDRPARTPGGLVSAPVAYTILPEQALREEAAGLEERAVQQEGQRPKTNGTAEADTVEQLVALVLEDAMALGPTIAAIQTWAELTEQRERDRRRKVLAAGGTTSDGYIDPAAPVRFKMGWVDSKITDAESGVLATGPSIDEKLKAVQEDRLVEERAARVDRALAWLEARGGDLRTAVARAEAKGGQEGIAANQWRQILEDAGVVATAGAEATGEDADLEGAEDADLEAAASPAEEA
jgi:hypothetical protein